MERKTGRDLAACNPIPTEFKGGGIWNVIVNINGALQAIGLALLVLFFVIAWSRPAAVLQKSKSQNTH
jgi:hypothetical protein